MFSGILSKVLIRGNRLQLTTIRNLPQRLCSSVASSEMMAQKQKFHSALEGFVGSFVSNPHFAELPDIAARMTELLDYQMIGGKYVRGLLTVMAYDAWEKPDNITEETLNLSYIMGWFIEIFHTSWLIMDDIVDASEKRRNKLCWHRLPNVGMQAINDNAILYSSMKYLLKEKFGNMPGYMQINDLFNKAFLYTSIGQHIDSSLSQRKHGYSMFTEENYKKMSKYKTTFYTFEFPVSVGMVLANKYEEENIKKVHKIIANLGLLYQMQNDFRDVYGESEFGINGNDIEQGKCTWLALKTLQLCSDDERKIFTSYYGSHEPAHVKQIKALYDQLDLPTKYEEEERKIRDEIVHHASNFGDSRVYGLFLKLLDVILNKKEF